MKKENERGITLIALVITIIVLLILAGVSIMMLTGENGIITRADDAKTKTEISNLKEQAEIIRQGIVTGNRAEGKETTREEIIEGILGEMGGEAEGNLIKTEDGKNEIMVKEDGEIEVVEKGEGYTDAEYKEPAPESDFRWTTLEDGTVRILEYLGYETSLNIPEKIEGKNVTVIWNDKVAGSAIGPDGSSITYYGGNISKNVKLKSVKIPDTVVEIGYGAFQKNELENVMLSENLLKIGQMTFEKNKIKNLSITSNVIEIGRGAFSNNKITKIEIPNKVKTIGNSAFSNNEATVIEIPESVTSMGAGAFVGNKVEKVIYGRTNEGKEDKTVINSYAGRNAGNVIIPDGVKKLESYAFSSAGVTSIEIPEGVEEVGGLCFMGKNLEKLIIPSTLKKSNSFAFSFDKINYLEFRGETTFNVEYTISVKEIEKMKVPTGSKEYYQNLISNKVISCSNVGSITE